jgi:pyruvate/2-oxoglutarate dehydrogenase complex dihydrolipoamide dehydrogenase (E3) component
MQKKSQLEFDYVVIGGGSAGYAAARTAREHCQRVAIIDGASELGGLCILRGCMPSKTLIYTAELQHHARHASTYGLNVTTGRADMRRVRARKRAIIQDFTEYRREQLESDRFTLLRANAEFIDSHTLRLSDGRTVRSQFFFIATGSVVGQPPVNGLDNSEIWTSDDVLELGVLPESVIVLGGGIVACELAQYLSRMDVVVTQIQRSALLLKEFPKAASETVAKVFRKEGIELFTGTKLIGIRGNVKNGFSVAFEQDGKRLARSAERVVNALGRVPATMSLGLTSAGIESLHSGHIKCNEFQQSSQPHIYAGGDCAGPHEIVHLAIIQGETAARHAFGFKVTPFREDHLVAVVFTDPQVAVAGRSATQLQADGVDFVSASYPFDDHGKSILMEARAGYVAIHAERNSSRILGAECVGKDAGELIHALAVAITLGATAKELLKVQWYHPTLSEIWSYPLEEIEEMLSA